MESTAGKLVAHLANSGMPLNQIAAYVGELGAMIMGEPFMPLPEMETAMSVRGWNRFGLDERTYVLTLLVVIETLPESGPDTALWPERPAVALKGMN
jgi:hypothetical protein